MHLQCGIFLCLATSQHGIKMHYFRGWIIALTEHAYNFSHFICEANKTPSTLWIIVPLDGEPSSRFQSTDRMKQVLFTNIPVFITIYLPLDSDQLPSPCCWNTSPQHNAATTLWVWCSWNDEMCWFWHSGFHDGQKFKFDLLWPKYFPPHIWGVS